MEAPISTSDIPTFPPPAILPGPPRHGLPFLLPSVSAIARDGIYLRSRIDGRYLLLRGVCFGPNAKFAPHLPIKSEADWQRFEPYLKLLLHCGLNVLRVPFSWEALEPECDPERPRYNLDYLESYFAIARRLTELGFMLFVDIHQDLLQAAYGGNGFPRWIKEDGSQDGAIMLNTPLWGLNYVVNKGLRKTFTQFWLNDLTNTRVEPALHHFKVRDRMLDMVELIAKHASENERIFGIEIINEPHPAELDPEMFERELLSDFYEEATHRIRKHSSDLFVMVSPQSDWNVNLRRDKNYRSLLTTSEATDDRVAFAFHYYDSLLTGLHGLYFHERKREEYMEAMELGVQHARPRGIVPFLTEFGSRQNWLKHVTRKHMHWHFEAVERAIVHATYWNVNFYNTRRGRDGFMREDFSLFDDELRPRNLDIAVRPYPIAWSAKPTSLTYNDTSRTFECAMEGRAVDAPTVIFLPYSKTQFKLAPHPFSDGFKVYYGIGRDKARVEFLPTHNQLLIKLDEEAEKHQIMIAPRDMPILANPEQIIFECGPS